MVSVEIHQSVDSNTLITRSKTSSSALSVTSLELAKLRFGLKAFVGSKLKALGAQLALQDAVIDTNTASEYTNYPVEENIDIDDQSPTTLQDIFDAVKDGIGILILIL